MHHRSMFTTLLACVALALGAAACAKPKDDDCKNAIANIRHLYGTANMAQGMSPQAAVRSCRGSASRESVQCIINAKTIQELESCAGGGEFLETMKDVSATQSQQAPATPTPAPTPQQQAPATPTPAPQAPAQDPAQPQQDPAQAPAQPQQNPAQPQPAQPQQNPAQPQPAQPQPAQPQQNPAQPQQNPAENPGQPAAPGQQPPAK